MDPGLSYLRSRTIWAERSVEEFLSLPLVSEFVFRSPQTVDGSQREVADFLVTCGALGILISQKCQDDPSVRTAKKLEAWAYKKTKKAASQLMGALRVGAGRPMWCEHPRRGRVDFSTGLPAIAQGIVLTEVFEPVVLPQETDGLPLEFGGIPISYFSLNDFLNLTVQLRTLPEIVEYLDRRRALPIADLRTIGEERSLFAFYLLNEGSFAGCLGISDAKVVAAAHAGRFKAALLRKLDSDRYSGLMEHVANELATRLPDYATGLSPRVLDAFDPPERREKYITIQRVLANLRLRERAELGRAFESTAENLRYDAQGFVYRAMRLDSQPDWAYVFGSSRKIERPELLSRFEPLMRGALAYYEKSRCLLVVDRDSIGYEAALSRPGLRPTLTDRAIGDKLFGNLRTVSRAFNFGP
ncbi:MAG TPA: hypothetical protein VFU86_06730 [Terriglobales bacterium]|nr:hypothetical protein [Terriglobales bacterium]